MCTRTTPLTDELYDYLLDHSLREPEVLRRLRMETAAMPENEAQMQIAPEQGQFMALLVRLIGARRALEVGTFTGYSSTVVALALPEDGEVVACDVSESYTAVARRYWDEAGITHKVDLRIGPALETLDALLDSGRADEFDLAFIDADKEAYPDYYERTLKLVRPGGLIIFDNVFRNGRVADPSVTDQSVEAIRRLNEQLHHDERIDLSMLPVADGLSLARVR